MKSKELVAKEGYWLTLAKVQEGESRNFWKRLYPAKSLTEDDFTQWSDEQKAKWEEEHPAPSPDDDVEPNKE